MTRQRAWAVGMLVMVGLLVVLSYSLFSTLLPLFLAFAFAYAVSPLVDAMTRRGVPRALSVIAILTALIAALALLLAWGIPALGEQLAALARNFPDYLTKLLDRADALASRFGLAIPLERDEILDRTRESVQKLSLSRLSPAVLFAKNIVSGAASVIVTFLKFLIVPVFFFFFLRDLPKTRRHVLALIPLRYQPRAREEFKKVDGVLSGYIRGQLLVAIILAVLLSAGLVVIGLEFGLVIGIAAGLLNMLPYVGQGAGFAVAMIVAAVHFDGWGRVIAVPSLFMAVQFLESTVITPKIVGDKVGLSPVWALMALIVGGDVGGFLGLLTAIPIAGCLRIFILDMLEIYRASDFYKEDSSGRSSLEES